jgi:hypothetical protein
MLNRAMTGYFQKLEFAYFVEKSTYTVCQAYRTHENVGRKYLGKLKSYY